MSSINFLTWYVRGIGSHAKKVKVLNHLNKLQADVCLLQETYLSDSDLAGHKMVIVVVVA